MESTFYAFYQKCFTALTKPRFLWLQKRGKMLLHNPLTLEIDHTTDRIITTRPIILWLHFYSVH